MQRADKKTYVVPDSIEKRSLSVFMAQEGADYLDAIIAEFKLDRSRVKNLYTHKSNGCPFVGIEVILKDSSEKKKCYVTQQQQKLDKMITVESMCNKLLHF